MLIRFVYLDRPTLEGYAAQMDGGLIAETKVQLVKRRTLSGEINSKFLKIGAQSDGSNNTERTMSYPSEAQFQRLLAVANDDPDTIAWIDVVDPSNDFASAQVGETIAWECDIDIDQGSRIAAQGGGGAQMLGIAEVLVSAGQAGLNFGSGNFDPEQANRVKAQAEAIRGLLDGLKLNRIAVGRDPSTTNWSVFGPLYNDHLQVEDIENERLIIVGKIKRIVPFGQTRKLLNNEAMQLMEISRKKPSGSAQADNPLNNEIAGPALELDILAVYR